MSTIGTHGNLIGENVHTPFCAVYTDSTARTAEAGFDSSYVSRIALQSSDHTIWLVASVTGGVPSWTEISTSGGSGADGTRGSLIYHGTGAPGTIGGQLDGDLYINTTNDDLYQLSGTWSVITNIKGSTGSAGSNGSNGTNGTNGTNGDNGVRGSVWFSGAGAVTSEVGQLDGDLYLNITNDDVYQLISDTWTLIANIRGSDGTGGGTRGSLWNTGTGAPTFITGQQDLDLYLNTTNEDLYQLIDGTWTLSTNIKGTTGTTGSTGSAGDAGVRGSSIFNGSGTPGTIGGELDGDWYLDTASSDLYKLSGTWGFVVNIKGATGSTGSAGSNGSNGADGARGSRWNSGSGAPGTISGQQNLDLYLRTSNQDVYQLISGTWTVITNIAGTGGGGSGATRDTFTYTTASLANNATENTLAFGSAKSLIMGSMSADHACWVRIYATEAMRTADASRAQGTAPADNGKPIGEWVFVSDELSVVSVPPPAMMNMETDPVSSLPISVKNESGSTTTIALTARVLVLES